MIRLSTNKVCVARYSVDIAYNYMKKSDILALLFTTIKDFIEIHSALIFKQSFITILHFIIAADVISLEKKIRMQKLITEEICQKNIRW